MTAPQLDLAYLLATTDRIEEELGIEIAEQFRWLLRNARLVKELEWAEYQGESQLFADAETIFTTYTVEEATGHGLARWSYETSDEGEIWGMCDSLDHGKQLAQQHYTDLIQSITKGVGE